MIYIRSNRGVHNCLGDESGLQPQGPVATVQVLIELRRAAGDNEIGIAIAIKVPHGDV